MKGLSQRPVTFAFRNNKQLRIPPHPSARKPQCIFQTIFNLCTSNKCISLTWVSISRILFRFGNSHNTRCYLYLTQGISYEHSHRSPLHPALPKTMCAPLRGLYLPPLSLLRWDLSPSSKATSLGYSVFLGISSIYLVLHVNKIFFPINLSFIIGVSAYNS